MFLFISGNETTRHVIANMPWTTANNPDLFERLRADRDLVAPALQESLRRDPPIRFLLRHCMADLDLREQESRRGDKVAFGLLPANRDETVFEDPHTFRLDRPDPRRHVAFGDGPHVCPGSSLARLEGRVALATFADRVGRVRPPSRVSTTRSPYRGRTDPGRCGSS
ncbi:MAG TPA: cytochrome P450 [Acidimicrobiales bacterium]|nr:cytochrome P450 [Acidimicrobiales bacterium]